VLVVCSVRSFPVFEILYSDASCEFELCIMDMCEETKCVQSAHDFQINLFVYSCM
jgi:hypothetical protein